MFWQVENGGVMRFHRLRGQPCEQLGDGLRNPRCLLGSPWIAQGWGTGRRGFRASTRTRLSKGSSRFFC